MNEQRFIILHLQFLHRLDKFLITDLEDIAVTDPRDGQLMVFKSLDEADAYREKYGINSQIIELPLHE